ncbi:hypothetical protein POTOM_006935 [Populus tomentosa]|uniref:Uncharacterized protein n=1 Tax=Populus tomentosa TaxID=118781 RepID=A0A8X8AP26_POPTO|nr:hypothetical protein POTOM_006935 [Populus tomentosa]
MMAWLVDLWIYSCKRVIGLQFQHPKRGRKPALKSLTDGNVQEDEPPSCRFQVDMSPKRDIELSVKVMLQLLEVSCDLELFLSLWELFTVLKSFEFQLERVLLSLNGIEDVRTRLLSKVEYILSSHKKLSWDVNVINIIINVPWRKAMQEEHKLLCLVFCYVKLFGRLLCPLLFVG